MTQDPVTGVYTLAYTGEDGIRRSVQFIGDDRVAPQLDLDVKGHGPYVYAYRLTNGSVAQLPIDLVVAACEQGVVSLDRLPFMRVWSSLPANYPSRATSSAPAYCVWHLGSRARVAPNTTFSGVLRLQSSWLPGVRLGWTEGFNPDIVLRGFRYEVDEDLMDLYHSTKKPFSLAVVSPAYDPVLFANPTNALGLVSADLDQVCKLGWIDNQGVCNSLSVKLQNAQKSLGTPAAKNLLQAFLNELSAQNGKHVNANAYALLSTNVSYIADKL
jgi:hypothetical protein